MQNQQPIHQNQQPAQNRPSAPPVFRSEPIEGNKTNLALWARDFETGAHVTGALTLFTQQGQQYTTKVSGFFGLSDKGDVRISLSNVIQENGKYITVGTIYFQKDNVMTFYPKDKSMPKLSMYATDCLHSEVAKAIGLKSKKPELNLQTPNPAPNTNIGTNTGPGTVVANQLPAPQINAQPSAQEQAAPVNLSNNQAPVEPIRPTRPNFSS